MKKVYIIATIAAVLAGISLFYFMLNVQNEARVDFADVVVAAVDIDAQTELATEMLEVKKLPIAGIHPASARKMNEVVGLVTSEKIFSGEQILAPKLKKIGQDTNGLSYTIPKDKRAITVATDDVSGIAGFIKQGDRVDVLTVVMNDGGEATQISKILMQNVQVLAVGKTLGKAEDAKDAPAAYTSVTLLTSPDDAVKLNLATSTGAIRFVLRGPTDAALVDIAPKTKADLSY